MPDKPTTVPKTKAIITISLTMILIGCTTIEAGMVRATLAVSPVPMQKNARSSFQPYSGENGDKLFMAKFSFFEGEDPRENNPHYKQWLSEWLTEYQYCKNGYEIISNTMERFAGSKLNARIGGFLVTHGRCKG